MKKVIASLLAAMMIAAAFAGCAAKNNDAGVSSADVSASDVSATDVSATDVSATDVSASDVSASDAEVTFVNAANVEELSKDEIEAVNADMAKKLPETDKETGNKMIYDAYGKFELDGKTYYAATLSWEVNGDHVSQLGDIVVPDDFSEFFGAEKVGNGLNINF